MDDPEFYAELDAELKNAGFDLSRKRRRDSAINGSSRSRGTVGDSGGDSQKSKFTEFGKQMMRQLGMNPNSKEDRKRYIGGGEGII